MDEDAFLAQVQRDMDGLSPAERTAWIREFLDRVLEVLPTPEAKARFVSEVREILEAKRRPN